MAMFGSGGAKDLDADDATPVMRDAAGTVIGSTVKVEGQFNSDDDVLIEGEVVGTITTTQDLTVGEGARIEGDVRAANMYMSGEVHGNLVCEGHLQLADTARIFGDIETNILSVETGAVLQGRCVTSSTPEAQAETRPTEPADEATADESEDETAEE